MELFYPFAFLIFIFSIVMLFTYYLKYGLFNPFWWLISMFFFFSFVFGMLEKRNIYERKDNLFIMYQRRKRWKEAAKFTFGKVLDIGCGRGEFSRYVSGEYTGVDKDKEIVVEAKKRFPDKTFLVKDIHKDKIDGVFDCITLIAFVEHFYSNELGFIKRLVEENLSQNGRLMLTTPSPRAKLILDFEDWVGMAELIKNHKKYWDKKDFEDFARFLNIKIETYKTFLFGFNQIVVYRKPI